VIGYTITSGTPTPEEKAALEHALIHHEKPDETKEKKSLWASPLLRAPLVRKA